MAYTDEFGRKIMERLYDKGWSASRWRPIDMYDSAGIASRLRGEDIDVQTAENINYIDTLAPGEYELIPMIKDSNNVAELKRARAESPFPTIGNSDSEKILLGFKLEAKGEVKRYVVTGSEDDRLMLTITVSYETFISELDTLPDRSGL